MLSHTYPSGSGIKYARVDSPVSYCSRNQKQILLEKGREGGEDNVTVVEDKVEEAEVGRDHHRQQQIEDGRFHPASLFQMRNQVEWKNNESLGHKYIYKKNQDDTSYPI